MSDATPSVMDNDRLWAMLCHLSTFVTVVPFANVIIPLIIWMVKRDHSALIADQGKEVLNFQITMMVLYGLMVICFVTVILFPFGILLVILLPIWHLVLTIIGAIKAYDGQYYRYPLSIRLI